MRELVSEGKDIIASIEELYSFVEKRSQEFAAREILLLNGLMGVGKTEFMRQLMKNLGDEEVFSPTFAIHNSYAVSGFNVDHIDLYRLEDEEDLESTGFWDLFTADKGIIAIEWADRLETSVLPLDWGLWSFDIEKVEKDQRQIIWKRWASRL